MYAQRVASKTTSLTRFADPPLMPKHELMLRNGATTRRSTSTTPREARARPLRSRQAGRGTWSRPWRYRRSFATLTCSAGSKPSGLPSSPLAASTRTRAVHPPHVPLVAGRAAARAAAAARPAAAEPAGGGRRALEQTDRDHSPNTAASPPVAARSKRKVLLGRRRNPQPFQDRIAVMTRRSRAQFAVS